MQGNGWKQNIWWSNMVKLRRLFVHELGGYVHNCKTCFRSRVQLDASKVPSRGNSFLEMPSIEQALTSFEQMAELPAVEDFICIMQKCRRNKNLAYAKRVHMHICDHGLEANRALGNYLVPMFVNCGSMSDAQQVFDRLVHQNEYSWTSLIQGYIECGQSWHALNLFQKMQENCVHPSRHTFVALLKACARMKCMERGQEIHAVVAKEGFEKDRFVGNSLVDMYGKCGSLAKAQDVFDELLICDVVSWNALIAGYTGHGLGAEALNCLELMQVEGVSPDAVTFVCSLKACITMRAIDKGREIHAKIAKEGFERNYFVGNILVDMYAKAGSAEEAQEVFDKLPARDVVSWNALITGYAGHGLSEEGLNCLRLMQLEGVFPDVVSWSVVISGYAEQGESEKAFELYAQMKEQGLSPNRVTFLSILKACGNTAALESGRKIHSQIYKGGGLETSEVILSNALIDMYGKCGSNFDARKVFDAIGTKDLVTWSTLIAGYSRQGESEIVFCLFEKMKEEGIQPGGITFLSVLTVCSHAGLVNKGQKYFESMSKEYGSTLTIEHHNSMVDLLGRAGRLDDAVVMLKKMPFQPDLVIWMTILGACRKWGNVELGRQAFDCAVRLDEKHDAAYIMMSNIYADAQMWGDMKKIEAMRVDLKAWKELGKGWIEIAGSVHTFIMGDTRHPQSKDIYAKLKRIFVIVVESLVPDCSSESRETCTM